MKQLFTILSIALALLVSVPMDGAQSKKSSHKPTTHKSVSKSSSSKNKKKVMTPKQLKRYNARRFDIHNIAVWGGGGYSGLLNDGPAKIAASNDANVDLSTKFVGGGGGMIGFGYEYNYKKFILSVGPEFRMFSSMDKLAFSNPYQMPMSEYNQIKYYQFDDFKETQAVGQIMLPVLFGGSLDKVYFKAGAKVGYTLIGKPSQRSLLSTTLYDPDAYDPSWENIGNHGLFTNADYREKNLAKNPFGLDIAVTAEVGVNLDKLLSREWREANEDRDRPIRMRIAAFADYGVMNMQVKGGDIFAAPTEESIMTKSWLGSEWGASKLNSLLVGVKFTAMLQMNKVREAKKQNGYLTVWTYDEKTDKSLAGASLVIAGDYGRPTKKTTNKSGIAAVRKPEGDWYVSATRSGYIGKDSVAFAHGVNNDTLRLGLMPIPVFKCNVKDAKTNQVLHASLQFIDVATDEVVLTGSTDSINGDYTTKLPMGKMYKVKIDAPDHYALTMPISALDAIEEYTLEPIIKKRVIILHNLFFATNQTTILPESESGLQDLYDLLNENPEIRVRITGHTDSVGSDKDNQILSEGRANSVRQNMIDRGIDPSRIEAEGKGESEPIDTNDTEEGRQNNRRVEMTIL